MYTYYTLSTAPRGTALGGMMLFGKIGKGRKILADVPLKP